MKMYENIIDEDKFEKYVKKPVIVEAYQTNEELELDSKHGVMVASKGDWIITGVNGEKYPCKPDIFDVTYDKFIGNQYMKKPVIVEAYQLDIDLTVHTLEGVLKANKGDWIIKGVEGELYPCSSDTFDKIYEKKNVID